MYYFQVSGLNFKSDFSLPVIVKTFLSDILVFGWLIFYIQGWTYSLTSHADIMSCSSGTVIFIITVVTWGVVHKYEVFAYILYFVGIFFLLTDPYALKEGKNRNLISWSCFGNKRSNLSCYIFLHNKVYKISTSSNSSNWNFIFNNVGLSVHFIPISIKIWKIFLFWSWIWSVWMAHKLDLFLRSSMHNSLCLRSPWKHWIFFLLQILSNRDC